MKKKKRKMRTGRGGKRNQRIRRNRRLIVLAGIVTAAALVYFTVIIVGLIKNLHGRSSLSESGPYVKATKLANETPQNATIVTKLIKAVGNPIFILMVVIVIIAVVGIYVRKKG